MNDTFEYTQAALQSILDQIKDEVKELAHIYDSRDLFGIAYAKYSDKIIDIIDSYLQ